MVSPEHVNEQKPENKAAPDPAEEKQVLPASEHKRPWMEPLLRVGAVVYALIGGFAIVCLMSINIDFQGWGYLVAFLLGTACALLFRSWWAILVVPLALGLGEYLAGYHNPFALSNDPRLFMYVTGFGFWFSAAVFIPILAVIGSCIGSYLGVAWKKKQKL